MLGYVCAAYVNRQLYANTLLSARMYAALNKLKNNTFHVVCLSG